jgi:predicted RNA-binding protein
MSDTPRTDAVQFHHLIAHVPVHFARELERELNAANAEVAALKAQRDEAFKRAINAVLRADDNKSDPLAEMWAALAEYQPMADRDGHGESWRKMCKERNPKASFEALAAAESASALAASAALSAVGAAAAWPQTRAVWASDSIAAIRRAKEGA